MHLGCPRGKDHIQILCITGIVSNNNNKMPCIRNSKFPMLNFTLIDNILTRLSYCQYLKLNVSYFNA